MSDHPTKRHPIVKVLSRIVYKNNWLDVREDRTIRNGNKKGIYGVVEINDSVVICAINNTQKIYIVYGYNYPTDEWLWQLPGGGNDGQKPVVAADRELKEETGIRAERLELIRELIVSCGVLKERMSIVVATNLHEGRRIEADDSDTVGGGKFVSFDEVRAMIINGEIKDSQSIAAIYLAEPWVDHHGN